MQIYIDTEMRIDKSIQRYRDRDTEIKRYRDT